jgi:hypothetical protein
MFISLYLSDYLLLLLPLNRMGDEIKQLVQEAVRNELENEGKQLRYTKRFQSHYIATQQPPLVNRIEKTVEEKIKSLHNELAALKTARLNKYHHPGGGAGGGGRKNRFGHGGGLMIGSGIDFLSEGEDDYFGGEEEDQGGNNHGMGNFDEAHWFVRNETTGEHELDMRMLQQDINRTVNTILKRHLGQQMTGGGGAGGRGSGEGGADHHHRGGGGGGVHGHIHGDNNNYSIAPDSDSKDQIGFPEEKRNKSPKAVQILDSEPVVVAKPKSKADRLLGISTDSKSGLPFNDPTVGSTKPGVGAGAAALFGTIGNLFSTKPGAGGGAAAMSSMMSERFMSGGRPNNNNNNPVAPAPVVTAAPHISHTNVAVSKPPPVLESLEEGNEDPSSKQPLSQSHNHNNNDASNKLGSTRGKRGAGNNPIRKASMMVRDNDSSSKPTESNNNNNNNNNFTNNNNGNNSTASVEAVLANFNPSLAVEIASEETNYRTLMSNLLNVADVKASFLFCYFLSFS